MPVIVENNTKFPLTVYALEEAPEGKLGKEKWRCIIGNVDDRGRQIPVVNADGILIPGRTDTLADSKPRPPAEWRGRLPSPIAVFSNEEWVEVQKSPCWAVLDAFIKNGELTMRRASA